VIPCWGRQYSSCAGLLASVGSQVIAEHTVAHRQGKALPDTSVPYLVWVQVLRARGLVPPSCAEEHQRQCA
jgi:hypothetical protein